MQSAETLITDLIINAGESKSYAFEALNAAKSGDFDGAAKLMSSSKEYFLKAHSSHLTLLNSLGEALNDKTVLILFIHSEDHLMSSLLCRELIEELINTQKELQTLHKKINKEEI